MTLQDKHIVIVGGTSGFGLEVAKLCSAQGAKLTLIGRDGSKAEKVAKEIPNATGLGFDATDSKTLTDFFSDSAAIDHLVSTLGGAMGGGFLSAEEDTIRATVDGKLFANLVLARAGAPHLASGGSMTFTAGSGGRPDNASGAILGNEGISTLVRGLAIELAPKVRVNAVAPTWTPTPLWREVSAEDVAATQRRFEEQIPLKRTGMPREVAQAYLFLIGCDFITGQTINVDGGLSLL